MVSIDSTIFTFIPYVAIFSSLPTTTQSALPTSYSTTQQTTEDYTELFLSHQHTYSPYTAALLPKELK